MVRGENVETEEEQADLSQMKLITNNSTFY
jgi:hypothetical protein